MVILLASICAAGPGHPPGQDEAAAQVEQRVQAVTATAMRSGTAISAPAAQQFPGVMPLTSAMGKALT